MVGGVIIDYFCSTFSPVSSLCTILHRIFHWAVHEMLRFAPSMHHIWLEPIQGYNSPLQRHLLWCKSCWANLQSMSASNTHVNELYSSLMSLYLWHYTGATCLFQPHVRSHNPKSCMDMLMGPSFWKIDCNKIIVCGNYVQEAIKIHTFWVSRCKTLSTYCIVTPFNLEWNEAWLFFPHRITH